MRWLTMIGGMKVSVIGASINAAAILGGGSLGLVLKGRINERISQTAMKALGLCVCIVGISSAIGGDILLMVVALALGSIGGELVNIDALLNRLGVRLQDKLGKKDEKSTFAQGFVAATLLFCVGAMAVVGSLNSGLLGDHSVIITKSIIDAVAAMALASTLGFGVLFSAVAVFLYQGFIEFFAGHLQPFLTDGLIAQISAVGGVMILGIGVNVALNAGIRVANLLPGFVFAVLYYIVILG
ncbi:MAG: DUF554 domain-containing protein [Defluviitaleaceae bacterium]|nr:DUF554 domain-containing protein [Defluviitaleaceae bacterium]